MERNDQGTDVREPAGEAGGQAPPRRRGAAFEAARAFLIAVAVLLVLVLGLLIVIQTEWGRARVQGIAAGQIQALLKEDAEFEVRRIEGNFLTGARMLDAVVREGSVPVIEVDTLTIRYNLWTLFRRTFSASDVYLGGVRVWARQDPDSTWNVGRILRPADPDAEPGPPWTVRLGEAALVRGLAEVHFHHPERDSVLIAAPVHLYLRDFLLDEDGVQMRLDTLHATVAPAVIDPVSVDVRLAGTLEPESAAVDRLVLRSVRSDLRVAGRMEWADAFGFDAELVAQPLALADLRQFIAVPVYGVADARISARGTVEDFVAEARADFADHGGFDLQGRITTDPVARYDVRGTLTDFDPGRLLGDPALAGRLNAVANVDLAGPSPETMDGTARLTVRDSEFADQRIVRADLDSRFTNGGMSFTLDASVPGAQLAARGAARPFDDVPTYDVRGEVDNLDLGTLTRDPDQDVAVRSGTFHVEGRGIDPETLSLRYAVAATDARVDGLRLASGTAQGSLQRGLLQFDAGVRLPGDEGVVTAVGTARPFAEPLAYEVSSGTVQRLNLAALTGDPEQDSDLSGAFALRGVGTDPGAMRLDFAASLAPSRYGDLEIVSARAEGSLVAQVLNLELEADLGEAGRISAVGTAQPFADPVTYDFSGRVENLDLAALLDDPTQSSDLTGAFTLSGAGTDPETLVAELSIDLEPSRFRGQELLAGTFVGELRDGTLVATVEAVTPEGLVAFDLTMRPFDPDVGLALTGGRFAGLNLALVLDQPALQTDLHGRIDIDLTTFDLEAASGSVRIVFAPSTINAARLESGLLEVRLDAGAAEGMATLTFEQGQAGFVFRGRPFDDVPTYAVDGRIDEVDVFALASDRRTRSIVNAEFELTGVGLDPETMDARATVSVADSRLPEGIIETLEADIALSEGVLIAHAFELVADFADARATGRLALFNPQAETDLQIVAAIREAGPLDALTPEALFLESADVDGRFIGRLGEPIAFDGHAIVRRATYGAFGVNRLDLRASVLFDPDDDIPFTGRARVQFDFLALPTFSLQQGDVTLHRTEDEFFGEGRMVIDESRDLAFRTSFTPIDDPDGPYHTAVLIEQLDLRFGDDRWELLETATLSLGENRYLIRNFLLFANGQQIAADGEVDLRGEQTLLFTVEDVQVDQFVDLIGYQNVGGVLNAILSLGGDAAAPIVEAVIEIDDITSGGEAVGSLDASFNLADARLEVLALLEHVEGQTFRAEGFLPVAFRLDGVPAEPAPDAPVSLSFTSAAFPISWAEPFVPPGILTDLGGTLTTEVIVGGTYADPHLDGAAFLEDGLLQLEVTGDVVFRDILLELDFDGNEMRVVQAQVRDGRGGLMRIEGQIRLPELAVGEMDLLLLASSFRVIDTETYSGLNVTSTRADNLRFHGTIAEPILTGNVTLVSGEIFLTQELVGPDLEPVVLTEAEIQRIEATFGVRLRDLEADERLFVDDLDLDVRIVIERNVWVRSRQDPRFDVEFFGTVSVIKPPGAEFEMFGSIEVLRGRVEMPTLVRRRFEIGVEGTHAVLTFNGPMEEAIVDLRAGLQAPSGSGTGVAATVFVELRGRLAETPEFVLSSDPPMEPADIACVIATGRPCGEAFRPDIAEDIAIAQLGMLVEQVAAQQLGLDVVEVTRRPTGELVITFGSYVGERTFAAISQPVTEGRSATEQAGWLPEVLIEYEMLRWLLLRLEHRNIGGTGGALFIQFDY